MPRLYNLEVFMKKIIIALLMFCLPTLSLAAQGAAIIKGTNPDDKIYGNAILTEVDGGLSLQARFFNVPPGKHGFHIHENSSCADMGKAAGGHFNPDKVEHGLISKDGPMHAHGGDMGNVEIAENKKGMLQVFLPGLAIKDGTDHSVLGKTFILHEKEDDYSQPTGNAGGRIACGIIQEIPEQKQ